MHELVALKYNLWFRDKNVERRGEDLKWVNR